MSTPTPTAPATTAPINPSLLADPDYSQFLFEQERANYHTDFKSMITWVNTRAKSHRAVSFKGLAVTTNGEITIGTTTYNCTKWAFEQFCARLGIPRPFAKKIPADLLLGNITRLIQEAAAGSDTKLGFHFASYPGAAGAPNKEIIIGCTKEDYAFVDADDFLTAAAAMDGQGYTLGDLVVTDRMIDVDMLVDNQVVTTAKGVKYFVGINLRSSDCGDVNPTARLCLYQEDTPGKYKLGMVLSTEWGRVDRIRNKKMTIETTFANFMGHVGEMIKPIAQLQTALNNSTTRTPTDAQVKNYYETFNRAIDNKEAIDEILGWTEDERKAIFKEISIRRKNNVMNKLQGQPIVADPTLNFTEIELANKAAEYGNDAVLEERDALRKLAGSFFILG